LNAIERIEKGLAREGILNTWVEFNDKTDYVRGLILIEAKKDCEANNQKWWSYIKSFKLDGKSISEAYANRLIQATKEKAELSNLRNFSATNSSLNETEAELTLPKSASVQIKLRGANAIEKARDYQAIKEATGKDEPSGVDITAFYEAKNRAKEAQKRLEDKCALPERTKKTAPKLLTSDQLITFENWCLEERNFDVVALKPKSTSAIFALRDENVDKLFSRLDDWKSTYRIMAKLCHPDNGGSDVAMSMLNDFKELMESLEKIKRVLEYENKVKELKEEFFKQKTGK
jgi:hypothetical protein